MIVVLRREGGDGVGPGRPWGLSLEDLVAAYWRTNLTLRQLAPLFGVPKSAAGHMLGGDPRIIYGTGFSQSMGRRAARAWRRADVPSRCARHTPYLARSPFETVSRVLYGGAAKPLDV